jgi:glycosyltransferase involved in cell wall biosynthesis
VKVVGYLVPEFPGQTHVWIWREIAQLRRWDVSIPLFSTRRPPERDRARHAFAAAAAAETTYLWPLSAGRAAGGLVWALLRHPRGFARCLRLAATLPTTDRPRLPRLLSLVVLACELSRRCRAQGVDQLHTHSCANCAVLCMMVKRLLGIPYSMTLNAEIGWWGGAMAEKFGEAEFTTTHARWLLEALRRDFPGLRPEQAVAGGTGVDTSAWTARHRAPPPAGRTRVVTVARLHQGKGLDVLLHAVAALAQEGHDVTLRIAGEGPARGSLEALRDTLGLAGRARFEGSLAQEDVLALLEQGDVFALPSRYEALGVVYMEAMSTGLATIGSRVGGVPEVIEDGVDGVLVPPDDVPALTDALRRLATDPALRGRLGAAARRKIVARFDSRAGAAMLYQRLMGRPPPADGRTLPLPLAVGDPST